MVEVFVLVEPSHGQVVVTAILKRRVDRSKILQAAHGRDESVGRVEHSRIVEHNAGRVPSLLYFGVDIASAVVVGIDLCHDSNVHKAEFQLDLELILENHLQVGVEAEVVFFLRRGSGSVEFDEFISEGL
jgi:hypothetical protein